DREDVGATDRPRGPNANYRWVEARAVGAVGELIRCRSIIADCLTALNVVPSDSRNFYPAWRLIESLRSGSRGPDMTLRPASTRHRWTDGPPPPCRRSTRSSRRAAASPATTASAPRDRSARPARAARDVALRRPYR